MAAPVAIAAVTVDGRCRERSSADMALFGPARDRLVERFCDAAEGQDLLVRATADGSAEGVARLETAAGAMPFRISLWRQRGGDRIRLIAAFARAEVASAPPTSLRPDLARMNVPLQALINLAERVRAGTPEQIDRETSDLLSAAWRLKSILEDLDGQARSGMSEPRLSEIDICRLTRRVSRMAEAGLLSRRIATEYLEDQDAGIPNVLGDEQSLWDMLDHMVAGLVDGMDEGGHLTFQLTSPERGCTVSISAEPSRPGAVQEERLDAARRIAITHQGTFTRNLDRDRRMLVEVAFPPGRCLSAF